MSNGAGEHWSDAEVAATVEVYFAMLRCQLRRERYNKRAHNRGLKKLLNGRSRGAIEFKHANISAVLTEERFPCIEGYKPRSNYQAQLRREVVARLDTDREIVALAALAVAAAAPALPAVRAWSEVCVGVPDRELGSTAVYERPTNRQAPVLEVDYLQREANNASLGRAGEEFVLEIERRRLRDAGEPGLAKRVEHVSQTRGDGLGYDIASFDPDGAERLIEVKTTAFGWFTPFYASKREVQVSDDRAVDYRLYRVFSFRSRAKLFVLNGSLRQSCVLDPVQYRASLA